MQLHLAAGQCAILKSSGTLVVIFDVNEAGAYCRWLNGRTLEGATFDLASLEPVKHHEPADRFAP